MPTAPRTTRRPSFWVGLGGLALAMLVGAPMGWPGALGIGLLYLALSAAWGVLTTRTWWGPMPRGRAAAVGGGALVALVVVAGLSGGTTADDPAGGETPVADVAPSGTPSPSGIPSPSGTATAHTSQAPSEEPSPTPEPTPAGPAETAEPGTALATVALLEVKGRAPTTGYDRDEFGSSWADVDHNGCDQRNDVLRRDLTDVVTRAGTYGCVVLSGTFDDPYSGETMPFERGDTTSALVQIDHVVALSDAWQKGAQRWTAQKRALFGNDPLNLLASEGSLNQQKGDGDTATWLPPNKSFRCAYVARQVAVKHVYGLWVTQAERDAMQRVLSGCPDEPLPAGDASTPAAPLMPGAAAEEPADGSGSSDGTSGGDAVTGGDPSCPVKGNHSSSGEWIYHVPSGRYYDSTKPEECFDTPAEAEAAGYRASRQ